MCVCVCVQRFSSHLSQAGEDEVMGNCAFLSHVHSWPNFFQTTITKQCDRLDENRCRQTLSSTTRNLRLLLSCWAMAGYRCAPSDEYDMTDSEVTDCSPRVTVVTLRTVRDERLLMPPWRTVREDFSHSVEPSTFIERIVWTAR